MYKIYSKTEKRNATKLPFAPFSSKAENDINRVIIEGKWSVFRKKWRQLEKYSPFLMI